MYLPPMQKKPQEPSPLMTPAEVAQVWHLTKRTVIARTKPHSKKRNRVEPCFLTPDLRWKRDNVYADLEQASFHRELQCRDGRGRRLA